MMRPNTPCLKASQRLVSSQCACCLTATAFTQAGCGRSQGQGYQQTRIRASTDLRAAVGLAASPNGVLLAAVYTFSAAFKARCDVMYELRTVLGAVYIYRLVPPKQMLAIQALGSAVCDAPLLPPGSSLAEHTLGYGDEKVANRDTRVWHGATENGP
jgi:hypothetical protein